MGRVFSSDKWIVMDFRLHSVPDRYFLLDCFEKAGVVAVFDELTGVCWVNKEKEVLK